MNNYSGQTAARIFFLAVLFSILSAGSLSAFTLSDSGQTNIYSPENIKRFADYLFCQRDYLRAIEEYEKYLPRNPDDTVRFKMALGYRTIGYNRKAEDLFISLSEHSLLSDESKLELFKTRFFNRDYKGLRNLFEGYKNFPEKYYPGIKSLYNISFLLSSDSLPDEKSFLSAFPEPGKSEMKYYYQKKKDQSYKSPAAAAILSTIVPGAGKIYTKNYGDGITSLIVNGLLAYLAIDNFQSGHDFRAWVFSGLGLAFYAGNVYGSAASAQIYNAGIDYDFSSQLRIYLNNHNYFLSDYEGFCK